MLSARSRCCSTAKDYSRTTTKKTQLLALTFNGMIILRIPWITPYSTHQNRVMVSRFSFKDVTEVDMPRKREI
jgi:hypothetical protein